MFSEEAASAPADLSPVGRDPKLIVVVDTEEEFDWSRPHSRSATGVSHVRKLDRVQAIFERYGIVPTYVVDYAIASQEQGFRPLGEWLNEGRCEIGAHLHPWVNPPFDEELSAANSYPGNLPPALEREKLLRLTDAIATNFGQHPRVYRAGRYGIGPNTGAILEELEYIVDSSVVPWTNFDADGGPNFSCVARTPFWLAPSQRVLEIPLTVGWCGTLRSWGPASHPWLMSNAGTWSRLPAVFARLGLLERIRLTPEGITFPELRRLTDTLLATGERLFVLSFHSPSVEPGNTPYVRDEPGLKVFLRTLDQYCDYFRVGCGGTGGTLREVGRVLADQEKRRAERLILLEKPTDLAQ